MSSDNPNTGPSDETLKHLHGMLPSYAKAVAEKRIGGKGRKEAPLVPRKVCPICGTGMDHGPMTKALPEAVNCPTCQNHLNAGYTAFICGDRYIIAKSARLADMAGKMITLGLPVFERLAKEYEAEWRVKDAKDEIAGPA